MNPRVDKFRNEKNSIIILFAILTAVLFVPLFLFNSVGAFDFWWWMSANLLILITFGLFTDRNYYPFIKKDLSTKLTWKISFGIFAAAVLYIIFFFGNMLIMDLFTNAGKSINNVYAFKGGATDIRIAIMMLLVIGPGEEYFWRGFLQRKIARKYGKLNGYLIATFLYAGVHIASGNPVLILAALVCGLFWGWLFMKYDSPLLNAVSHTLWDLAIFILLPVI